MKTKIFLLFTIVLMAVASTSCKKASYLKADKQELSFTRTGGSLTVVLSSDVKEFKVTGAPNWVKATIVGNKLLATVQENNTNAPRRGSIVVEVPGKKLSIPVSQLYAATYLRVNPSTLTFASRGGVQTVKVECDGTVQVDAPSDVTATLNGSTLTVVAPANDGKSKTALITLTADEQTAKIYLVIKTSICPTCGGTGSITCPDCDGRGWYAHDFGNGLIAGGPCERCGGQWTPDDDGWDDGSGQIPCPTCHGTGRLN